MKIGYATNWWVYLLTSEFRGEAGNYGLFTSAPITQESFIGQFHHMPRTYVDSLHSVYVCI